MEQNMQHASVTPEDLTFHLLETITDGFSNERKVGSGGFGEVYWGVYKEEKIAVKKLYPMQGLDDVEFIREFNNLMRVQHDNIVRLVGYCYEIRHRYVENQGQYYLSRIVERALCFEYLENGSLAEHLSDESSGLDWQTRFKIIKGICEGLKYLHNVHIYHLDMKPANILLDTNMSPKIADFGLSILFGNTTTWTTRTYIGTIGYMPPEYTADRHMISDKYDVFSLGVIIMKIMAGHGGSSTSFDEQFCELVHDNWMRRLHATSHTSREADIIQVKECLEIALRCLEVPRENRPTVAEIVNKLNEIETLKMSIGKSCWLDTTSHDKCYMLSSRLLNITHSENHMHWRWITISDSRFAECAELRSVYWLAVSGKITTEELTPDTRYAVYLVYRLTSTATGLKGYQTSSIVLDGSTTLATNRVSVDPDAHVTGVSYPVPRGDGWQELMLAEFATDVNLLSRNAVTVDFCENNVHAEKRGLIIEGMEFRANN